MWLYWISRFRINQQKNARRKWTTNSIHQLRLRSTRCPSTRISISITVPLRHRITASSRLLSRLPPPELWSPVSIYTTHRIHSQSAYRLLMRSVTPRRCLHNCTSSWTRFVNAAVPIVSGIRHHSAGLWDHHENAFNGCAALLLYVSKIYMAIYKQLWSLGIQFVDWSYVCFQLLALCLGALRHKYVQERQPLLSQLQCIHWNLPELKMIYKPRIPCEQHTHTK